jgi:hypothetical protein
MIRQRPATIVALAVLAVPGLARATPCAPALAPHPVDTVRAMYAAAMAGDKAGVTATFAPDFHAFDVGKRYSAAEFAGIVDALRAMHVTMAWTVNTPRETVSCDVAWLDWDNRGSATDAHGTVPLEWLESAVLRWQDGAWKIAFFHSTQVAKPAPQ